MGGRGQVLRRGQDGLEAVRAQGVGGDGRRDQDHALWRLRLRRAHLAVWLGEYEDELNGIPWQEPRTDNGSVMSRTQSSSGTKSSGSPSGLAPRRRETSRSATLWASGPRLMRASTAMPTTRAWSAPRRAKTTALVASSPTLASTAMAARHRAGTRSTIARPRTLSLRY